MFKASQLKLKIFLQDIATGSVKEATLLPPSLLMQKVDAIESRVTWAATNALNLRKFCLRYFSNSWFAYHLVTFGFDSDSDHALMTFLKNFRSFS